MSPNPSLSEFLYSFNSTIAVAAIIVMYLWIYYFSHYLEAEKMPAKASKDNDLAAAIQIQIMDNELLDATVLELQALIYDMWDEQDRRSTQNHKMQIAVE